MHQVTVTLPSQASGAFTLRDNDSKLAIEVAMRGASGAVGEVGDGYLVYRGAHAGSDTFHRVVHEGTEDYVAFVDAPSESGLVYDVALGDDVAGLRLVENELEFIDAEGTPRLRVDPPYVIDARGERSEARLGVSGCAYDDDPRVPWGRKPRAPDARRCTVRVDWTPAGASYPLLVDPLWVSTGSPAFRPSALTTLSDGRVLGCNGSCAIYDGTTMTWASTGSGGGGSSLLLGDGRVLSYGPAGTSTTCANTTKLYSPTTGTWSNGPNLAALRGKDSNATLLNSGLVLVTQGQACATDANAIYAELFNTTSGGTLYDTAHPIPSYASSTLLASGKALIAGGGAPNVLIHTAAWYYDPASTTFASAPPLPQPRTFHRAVRLANGKVWLSAGLTMVGSHIPAIAFNPAGSGSWETTLGLYNGNRPSLAMLGSDLVVVGDNYSERLDFTANTAFPLNPMLVTYVNDGPLAAGLGTGAVLVTADGRFGTGPNGMTLYQPQANGAGCTNQAWCASKFCVSGVCCSTACTGICQSCSAATKQSGTGDGTCGVSKAGTDPNNTCMSQAASTCGTTGLCNASGACALYPAGTACQPTTCSNGVQIGTTCNGSGNCNVNTPVACTPYVCGGTACATTCSADTGCIAGSFCHISDQTCQPDQADGSTCTAASQCTSGSCTDGVCCDQPCSGACQACTATKKGSGIDGTCGSVKAGTDPDLECPEDGASTCARDGLCNGTGACELYGAGTSCGATTCSAGVQTGLACNGLGTCNPATTSSCAPYVCANGSACASSCNDDTGCSSTYWCRTSSHTCQADQGKGNTCTLASQCQSGNCVDGFCCDAPCAGSCQACSALQTGAGNGSCAPVKKATDPDGECPDDGASSCARDGLCDGVGSCRLYASGTACGTTTCTAGTQAGYACNGSGTCQQAQTSPCTPYLCNGVACGVTCGSDADCIAGAYCDAASHCSADLGPGLACTKGSQCTTGNCVDGVCCDQACSGVCQACTKAKKGTGLDGVCGTVAVDTDPDDDCLPDSPSTCKKNGNCDGSGACKVYQPGTACGAAVCSVSTLTGLQCNGLGACVAGLTSKCDPYVCLGSSNCAASCADDTGCVASNYCAGTGACQPKKALATSCGAAHECSSGFCVEGVCCNTACNGVCQACTAINKDSGADGTCGDAKTGTDAHNDCADEGASTCKRDGACNGQGACRLYLKGAACGTTNCVDNTQTGHACDGVGVCQPNETVPCELYTCSGGACTTRCKDSGDCAPNAFCDAIETTCKKKNANGTACTMPETCASGFCVDGYCCDQACGGQCQACDIATAKGSCSPVVGAPHDGRPACEAASATDPCSARACDGAKNTASCVSYVAAEVTCRSSSCTDGIETFSATCDGTGQCGAAGPAKTKKCEPYVCKGDICGNGSCASDADCAPKFRCNTTKKDCVPRDTASCDGDHLVNNPDGTTTECAPYKCEGIGCKSKCESVDDCVPGFVCGAGKACVAGTDNAPAESGCGCRIPSRRGRSWPVGLIIAALALAGARRRKLGIRTAWRFNLPRQIRRESTIGVPAPHCAGRDGTRRV